MTPLLTQLSLLNTCCHDNGWPNSHSNVFTCLGDDQTGKELLQNPPSTPISFTVFSTGGFVSAEEGGEKVK